MNAITPCLWFDTEGEAAAEFYTSVFPNSKIVDISRYGSTGPRTEGTVMTVDFELNGQPFIALNGGPDFTFNEANLPRGDLRGPGGGRPLLGGAHRRRGRGPLRLAEGQVRPVVAGRTDRDG